MEVILELTTLFLTHRDSRLAEPLLNRVVRPTSLGVILINAQWLAIFGTFSGVWSGAG